MCHAGPVRSRLCSFALCLAAASVIHGACAAAAAGWSVRISSAPARAAPRLQAMFVAMAPAPEPVEATVHSAAVDPSPAVIAAPRPAASPVDGDGPVEPPIDLSRFLPIIAVDTPAMPKDDWLIEPQLLDRLGASRIVFEILIDEHGQLLRCRLEQPADAPAELAAALQRGLERTPMTAALRRGSPVASVRHIELLLEP